MSRVDQLSDNPQRNYTRRPENSFAEAKEAGSITWSR